ncbi:MAG: hypothetical protein Q8P30_02845 [Candidatus Uhrbacteria bacterium]|nr:hypothetical protein [Candidatus Uhrbacteria bacterium]
MIPSILFLIVAFFLAVKIWHDVVFASPDPAKALRKSLFIRAMLAIFIACMIASCTCVILALS